MQPRRGHPTAARCRLDGQPPLRVARCQPDGPLAKQCLVPVRHRAPASDPVEALAETGGPLP